MSDTCVPTARGVFAFHFLWSGLCTSAALSVVNIFLYNIIICRPLLYQPHKTLYTFMGVYQQLMPWPFDDMVACIWISGITCTA